MKPLPTMEQGVYNSQTAAPVRDASSWQPPGPGREVTLIDVLTQLAYRKWLVAKVTAIALVVGVTMCLVLPVRYTATTKIMPPPQSQSMESLMMNQLSNIGAASPLTAVAGGLGVKNPNDLYVGLLNSRPIADALIRRFGLATVYRAKDMTAARLKLADATVVVSEKNSFIEISVTDKDRKRVAEMANAYTEELRILTRSLAVTEASQRRLFYEEQLKQAKDALVSAELTFQQIQQNKGLVQLDAQAKAMIEGSAQLRAQVAAKQVDVQALRSYSTENNPDVQLAERELSSLQAQASRLEQSNPSAGFAEMGLADVPRAGLEYLRADHELRYRQALFDMLMKHYDAARLDEAKDAAIIQVVEPAIEPDRRSAPKRMRIVGFSAAIGLFSGCGLALLFWWKSVLVTDEYAAEKIRELNRAIHWRAIR